MLFLVNSFFELNTLAELALLSEPKLIEKCPLLNMADPAGLTAIALRSPPRAPKAPLIDVKRAVP